MTPAERDLRYYAALGLAAEASHLALGYFNKRESLGITMKGAQDWLTVADGKVEDFLRRRLSELFPQDTVIGEEGADRPPMRSGFSIRSTAPRISPMATATGASPSASSRTASRRSASWRRRPWARSMPRGVAPGRP